MRTVSDLRIERSDFRRFIARMQARTSSPVRIASVTHTPLAFGMARMCESFLELASCPSEVRVFDGHTDVAEWILRGRDGDHVEWLCERLSSTQPCDARRLVWRASLRPGPEAARARPPERSAPADPRAGLDA